MSWEAVPETNDPNRNDVTVMILWNALPPDLKELSNTKTFKQKLKIYLLSQ